MESLPIHLEFITILWIENYHNTVWKDGAHNEGPRPTSFELPCEDVKVESNFLSRDKILSVYALDMKELSPTLCYFCILICFISYLLQL